MDQFTRFGLQRVNALEPDANGMLTFGDIQRAMNGGVDPGPTPTQLIAEQLAMRLARQIDDIVVGAARKRLGRDFDLRELVGRLRLTRYPDGRQEWVMDDRPLVTIYAPSFPDKPGHLGFELRYELHGVSMSEHDWRYDEYADFADAEAEPDGTFGASSISSEAYKAEQREKNEAARALLDRVNASSSDAPPPTDQPAGPGSR